MVRYLHFSVCVCFFKLLYFLMGDRAIALPNPVLMRTCGTYSNTIIFPLGIFQGKQAHTHPVENKKFIVEINNGLDANRI